MAKEYTNDNRNREDLSNIVTDLPMPDLALLDIARRNTIKATAVKHEWLEMPLETQSVVVGAANWDDIATTNLDIVSTTGLKIYDVLQLQSEIVIVSEVTSSSKIAVFARGHGSTSAATHASGIVAYIIGSAAAQGNASGDPFSVQESTKYNYCQIFKEEIDITRTQEASQSLGGRTLAKREAQAISRIFSRMNRALWFSVISEDTTNKIWTMKGLVELISSSTVNASSAAFSLTLLNSLLKKTYDAGRPSDVLFMPAFQYEKFNTLLENKLYLRPDDRVYGGQVRIYESPYGPIELKRDYHLSSISPSTCYVGNKKFLSLAILRNLESWENGPSGSSYNKQFEMEATLEARHEATQGKLYGLTTS